MNKRPKLTKEQAVARLENNSAQIIAQAATHIAEIERLIALYNSTPRERRHPEMDVIEKNFANIKKYREYAMKNCTKLIGLLKQ